MGLAAGEDGGRLAVGDDGGRFSSRMCESRAVAALAPDDAPEDTPDDAIALVPETGALDASLTPFVSASFAAASSVANVTLRMPRAFEFALERFALDLNSAPRMPLYIAESPGEIHTFRVRNRFRAASLLVWPERAETSRHARSRCVETCTAILAIIMRSREQHRLTRPFSSNRNSAWNRLSCSAYRASCVTSFAARCNGSSWQNRTGERSFENRSCCAARGFAPRQSNARQCTTIRAAAGSCPKRERWL